MKIAGKVQQTQDLYLLGLDIGSSSVKAALFDVHSRNALDVALSPAETPLSISAPLPGWAEQEPETWWQHCRLAIRQLMQRTGVDTSAIQAIGLAYQMHGLVCLDGAGQPVRPAIIWCDSRASALGEAAFYEMGADYCRRHYLNAPGNFTAAKLKWVQMNEPRVYARIRHFMLPGDYVAYRLTGEMTTTLSGLSEGILWDFLENRAALELLEHWKIDVGLSPTLVPTFGIQGQLSRSAAAELGLPAGIPVAYRAGDQPNNALTLNVLRPGELAATGGTSGVVYGVTDLLIGDSMQRVNSFAHVNHTAEQPRIGVLLCINGAGIQYDWLRQQTGAASFAEMENLAASVPAGADGLCVLPFGNGAERLLGNRSPGAQILGLDFNRHGRAHLYRAALEGIAFAFAHGMKALRDMGLPASVIRVGNDNLFQSAVFSATLSTLTGCRIEMFRATGAIGAAIGAGCGAGVFPSLEEGLSGLQPYGFYAPAKDKESCFQAYERWLLYLQKSF